MMYERSLVWKWLFLGVVLGYCLYYAPFGVNETDGGFLTGLAWQVLNGKVLCQDILYVRPPLPVWLRALELQMLPDQFAVLGERWIFYFKIALYSWFGAAVLTQGERRWQLAVLGFVVSAHCYPPMAWHTVDGIFFAVLAAFLLNQGNNSVQIRLISIAMAGVSLFASLLCKQSFYPLLPLFALFLLLEKENRWSIIVCFLGAFLFCTLVFFNYLDQKNILAGFLQMTSGAASSGQALQHGLLDYFRITPELALPSLVLLTPVGWWFWKGKNPRIALAAWLLWLLALVASYAAVTWIRQDHTVPFAQARVMFLVAGFWFVYQIKNLSLLLLGISWCAAVSWGYNLPILFATPWVWAAMEITRLLKQSADIRTHSYLNKWGTWAMLIALLLAFRIGHEFVYRDGRRSEMTVPLGTIFPQLSGIYSDPASADLYRDLKQLSERYGPNFKVLPAFPQANFLTKTSPPLPLDWVVNRETNAQNELVFNKLKEKRPVIFIQKSFRAKIENDPEMEVVRTIFQKGNVVEETPNFWVIDNYAL